MTNHRLLNASQHLSFRWLLNSAEVWKPWSSTAFKQQSKSMTRNTTPRKRWPKMWKHCTKWARGTFADNHSDSSSGHRCKTFILSTLTMSVIVFDDLFAGNGAQTKKDFSSCSVPPLPSISKNSTLFMRTSMGTLSSKQWRRSWVSSPVSRLRAICDDLLTFCLQLNALRWGRWKCGCLYAWHEAKTVLDHCENNQGRLQR